MFIIGITGTLGAGKGTVVDYLVNNKNFNHFSVRSYLNKLIKKDGNLPNRDLMVTKANDLRTQFGPSYIVDQLYKLAFEKGGNCIIESLRTPGEIESLKNKDKFVLIAVDANPTIRFDRIKKRNSETDNVNYEEFLQNEKREMASTDPNKQNIKKCIEMSDFKINNNGSLESLYEQIETILKKIN